MKYCRNCHILYSSAAAACPKCGITEPKADPPTGQKPESRAVRRDWLWILIGVPVLIGVVYLLILLLKSLG